MFLLRHFYVSYFRQIVALTGGNEIDSRKKALLGAKLALERKAEDIVILDMRKASNFCDYFVVCSASSQRRAAAIAELIEEKFSQQGFRLKSSEGKREGMWILLDYSDIVIHIFFSELRGYYALDRLWQDAKRVNVPKIRTTHTDTSGRKR